ncbi:hypothetical protein SK128_028023, partial [Halocaridina rubra]
ETEEVKEKPSKIQHVLALKQAQPKLIVKAANALSNLISEASDYEVIKQGNFDPYSVTTEAYRPAFRHVNKTSNMTYLESSSEKLKAFKEWAKKAEVTSFKELRNIIVFEVVNRKIPNSLMICLSDRKKRIPCQSVSRTESKPAISVNSSSGGTSVKSSSVASIRTLIFCSFCKKEGLTTKFYKDPKCKQFQYYRLSTSVFTKPLVKQDKA